MAEYKTHAAIWLALLVAPLLALMNLTVVYALVVSACEAQTTMPLHLVSACSLLLSLLFTFMAWHQWQQHAGHQVSSKEEDTAEDDAPVRQSFLPAVAATSGLLSSLVIAAQWIPQWILSPCFA
ncbi:MAG TPA: hypothetical protein VD810_04630 [Methylophilaceae bacterium]|nr:hypothetical protein [Methylophilaceae bacterium]